MNGIPRLAPENARAVKAILPFSAAHFGHHVLTALVVPLLPLIRGEFGLNYAMSGAVVSAFGLSYGLGQLPAGWLADRKGHRPVLAAGIVGVAAAGMAVGLSAGLPMLIGTLIVMGLLGGGYHPAAAPLISAAVEPGRRGMAFGLHVVGGSLSHFMGPLLGVGIAAFAGWRGAFIGLSVPVFVFGLAFYVFLGRLAARGPAGTAGGPADSPLPTAAVATVLVLTTVMSAVIGTVASFVPLLVTDQYGGSPAVGAAMLALLYSVGLWAAPLGGYLADRVGRLKLIVAIALATGPAAASLPFLPFPVGGAVMFVLVGAIMFMRMPVVESYLVTGLAPSVRATVLGVYYFAGMEAGGVLTPVLGAMIDRFGFQASFAALGAGATLVFAVCLAVLAAMGAFRAEAGRVRRAGA